MICTGFTALLDGASNEKVMSIARPFICVRMFPPFFRFSILNKIARRKVPKLKTKLKIGNCALSQQSFLRPEITPHKRASTHLGVKLQALLGAQRLMVTAAAPLRKRAGPHFRLACPKSARKPPCGPARTP